LILLLVAFAIVGVGVAVDGNVLPSVPDTEALLEKAVQSSRSTQPPETSEPTAPSEVVQQLRRAVDAANRSEEESAVSLEAEIAASKTKVEAINGILEKKSRDAGLAVAGSERAQQFESRLGELSARLEEVRPSN